MRTLIVILFSIFLFPACVEDFDLRLENSEPRLVVEGLITNKKGPYYIRLTKSDVGINSSQGYNPEPIMDAIVVVKDNLNQTDTLNVVDMDMTGYKYNPNGYYKLVFNESGKVADTLYLEDPFVFNKRGFYKTSHFRGIEGRTYFLEIIWQEKKYEASSYMSPVPEIDSIGYLLKKSEIIGKSDSYTPLLYFAEPQGIKNYYLIQLQNDILAQSGYTASIWQFSILSDSHLEPYVNGLNLSTGASPRGDSFYPIYNEGDSIYVALSSLSEQGYRYYKNLLDQFENDGGAYKPTPASPPTNISNGGLGLFRASAISEKRTKIPEDNR